MLTGWDYTVIVFYFIFIGSLGFVFKKFNKGSKDYFAGGQRMCWWLLGGSLFIANFSCWTFTGAAGVAHKFGILIMYVYLMDVLGYVIGYLFFATRLRQMRLITSIDGIRRRFGKTSEQIFNWMAIVTSPFGGAVWLLGLGMILTTVFSGTGDFKSKPTSEKVSAIITMVQADKPWVEAKTKKMKVGKEVAIFRAIKSEWEKNNKLSDKQWASLLKVTVKFRDLLPRLENDSKRYGYSTDIQEAVQVQEKRKYNQNLIIVLTGLTVLIMAMLGGNWAVAASDFIQLLLLLTITVVTAVLAIVKVGGVGAFYQQLPEDFFTIFYPLGEIRYDWLFLISTIIGTVLLRNNMITAAKYISAKDSEHARRSTLIPLIGYAIFPLFWFVPVWASYTLVPDMISKYTGIVPNPEEISYIVTAIHILPQGLLGLLVVGLFAATMSSMDTAFNKNAGFIVCNFYRDILRPKATDKELFIAGQVATAFSGSVVILVALWLNNTAISVFDSYLYIAAYFGTGGAAAFLLGMFIKRTPPWAAWVTSLFGTLLSLLLFGILRSNYAAGIIRPLIEGTFLSGIYEYIMVNAFFMTNAIITPSCILFFLLTRKFYNPEKHPEFEKQVDELFVDMKTPVDFDKEIGAENDNSAQQARTLGMLAIVYGSFIMLLIFIPNPTEGRIAIFGCASVMITIGSILWQKGRKMPMKKIEEVKEIPVSMDDLAVETVTEDISS